MAAQALEYRLGGEIYNRFYQDDHFWDSGNREFNRREVYNIVTAAPSLSLAAGKMLTGYLQADMEWTHFFDPEPEDVLELRLTNAYANLSMGNFLVSAGKMFLQLGKGLLIANEEPTVILQYEAARKYYLNITAAQVLTSSPMAALTLGYRPGFLEKIECFGVFFQDRDDGFAEMLNNTLWFDGLRSEGGICWLGLNLDFFVSDLVVSGVAMLEKGKLDVTSGVRKASFDISAYLLDMSLDYNVTDRISAGVFFFLASGDNRLREEEVTAFVSPLPFNPRGAIFFDPGFVALDLDQEEILWPGGVTMAGAVVPGARLSLQLLEPLSVDWMVATYYPEQKPARDRDWYGWETDLLLTYRWSDSKRLFFEADWFSHGNYFRRLEDEIPETATRILAGFHLVF